MDTRHTDTETRHYLVMQSAEELCPAPKPQMDVELKRLEHPDPEFRRRLYEEVGERWQWRDRYYWTNEEWNEHSLRSDIEIWILWSGHEAAGFFELEDEPDGGVRITHFGLVPDFIGCGLGGYFLTLALQRAWAKGAKYVWLHTSSFDHPHALANYQARGFKLIRVEHLEVEHLELAGSHAS
jgi:GNAT superfamily N-acetyltransferase